MRAIILVLLGTLFVSLAVAEPIGRSQEADSPFAESADAIARDVEAYGRAQRPTAIVVMHEDRVIGRWGDLGRRVNVRSVRKSLLNALYGIAVFDGRIGLSSTLAKLDVDDQPPLTDAEKRATVRDLLMARSGIYHRAAYQTSDIRHKRPSRGSREPGTFWFYNNWDFNALGTIYRRATGEDIFRSFALRIAKPIGMEDFSARDGRYVTESSSLHPAYAFSVSARDLARFGLLYLNEGRWKGQQIVPAQWIKDSVKSYSETDRAQRGYGYLWWVLSPEEWGPGAFMASGYGGQAIVVVPSRRLVAVETVDLSQNGRGIRTPAFLDLVRKIVAASRR